MPHNDITLEQLHLEESSQEITPTTIIYFSNFSALHAYSAINGADMVSVTKEYKEYANYFSVRLMHPCLNVGHLMNRTVIVISINY